ncbi:hypothetical protein A2773_02920 [Candidatus Gottesmanbacteria bacterium RIFCSPHIGHO2_01_FULL_39_10]|uniref:ATP-grasp domain-containing protein n=1 Tax=Candidatus Gottesmanbacteria bacterium RIFCSPHIGHO2_01_FULL_39_10 TaxID=1798375 RepID=A0A1F5ZPU4_9BACT|nr:MAG: hypothetical protein A2773_02920 [Candidatus Gottesmanbacteria bacterium RIFCSPHIGHO2_01_FULL_39_10]
MNFKLFSQRTKERLIDSKRKIKIVASPISEDIVSNTLLDIRIFFSNEGLSYEYYELEQFLQSFPNSNQDFIYKIIHGAINRTGVFQNFCDSKEILYTGHYLQTDLLAQDKLFAKKIMEGKSIPTPQFQIFPGDMEVILDFAYAKPNQAFVIKPNNGNSSEGVQYVDGAKALKLVLLDLNPKIKYLIENYIPGRIYTVGVIPLDNQLFLTAPMEYIISNNANIMDSDWKKTPIRRVNRQMPTNIVENMQRFATDLHNAIDAIGITRSDFILSPNGEVYALEINSNVGLSRSNDVPYALQEMGYDYSNIVYANIFTAFNR